MNRRTATVIAVAVLLIGGWFIGVFRPLSAEQATLMVASSDAEDRLAEYNRIATELPNLLARLQELQSSRENLLTSLIARDDILRLFDLLQVEAQRHDLEIVDLSPSVQELLEMNRRYRESTEPLFLNLTLTMEGDFIQYGKFVRRVEQAPYFRGLNLCEARSQRDHPRQTLFTFGFTALLGNEGGGG